MAWNDWRKARTRERAKELGVSIDELRAGPIKLTGWYFGWLAFSVPETALYQFLRMLEVPAIIIALVAFWIDYADRPIDRATRNAQLLAQVAELATIDHANASGGIKAILEFLADETVSMRGIALEQTKLSGVDLERAHLRFAKLMDTTLIEANLSGADFTNADLSGADLSGADLSGADLTNAELKNAHLSVADLTNADLSGASLLGTNLSGANLTRANLTNAGLKLAKLTHTNLTRADLTSTDVMQYQLDTACIRKDGRPPTLPEGLKPPQKECVAGWPLLPWIE